MEDYDDNLNIPEHDIECGVIKNLEIRYKRNMIYTFSGKLLIAINPMKIIELYSEKNIMNYRLEQKEHLPPHIYSIANQAASALKTSDKSQCIIVMGESGSGKTVTTQNLTQFLCESHRDKIRLSEQVTAMMKLLNIFGNAETQDNSDSSRFVKFLQFKYDSNNELCGVNISCNFLEISRLCMETTFGSNFHILYLLTMEAPDCLKKKLGLKDRCFRILSGRKTISSHSNGFNDLDHALDVILKCKSVKNIVYELVAAILHLCNIELIEDPSKNAHITDDVSSYESLKFAAELLKIDSGQLMNAITHRSFKTNSTQFSMPINVYEAMRTRDSIAKHIYKNLFQFLIRVMNSTQLEPETLKYIGILDIAGFECDAMGQNSFEQLCINYINEKIQQFCIRRLIKDELEWYNNEGICIPTISFLDNEKILDLFEEKPQGILSLLDDEIKKRIPSNDTFFQNLRDNFSKHSAFVIPKISKTTNKFNFVIKHFAKDVCYSAMNFVEKNTERLSCLDITDNSLNRLRQFLNIEKDYRKDIKTNRSITSVLRYDLERMISNLKENDSHFIRCIKANNTGEPDLFDINIVKSQLRANSIASYISLVRYGYPTKIHFDQMLLKFESHLFKSVKVDKRKLCEYLLLSIGYDKTDFKLGQTQVFYRPGKSILFEQLDQSNLDTIKKIVSKIETQFTHDKWNTIVDKIIGLESKTTYTIFEKRIDNELNNLIASSAEIKQTNHQEKLCCSNVGSEEKTGPNKASTTSKVTASRKTKRIKKTSEVTSSPKAKIIKKEKTEENRFDKLEHWPQHDEKKFASRCKLLNCSKKTNVYCEKCLCYLCFTSGRNCFVAFHKKS